MIDGGRVIIHPQREVYQSDMMRLDKHRSEFIRSKEREIQVRIIEALFLALEYRDQSTAKHSLEVARYSYLLALRLDLDHAYLYYLGGLMHDIGKLSMNDQILKGTHRLTPGQRKVIQNHVADGVRLLKQLELPQIIIDMAAYHHERVNGSGYLHGLQGDQIPLVGKIAAIADLYAALIVDRPYQGAKRPSEALRVVVEQKDLFDPNVFNEFMSIVNI